MLVPQRRGELESFLPEVRRLEDDPELAERYQTWSRSRLEFNAQLAVPGSSATKQRWQKDYFQGVSREGQATPDHQTKLALREFVDRREEPRRSLAASAESVQQGLIVEENFGD